MLVVLGGWIRSGLVPDQLFFRVAPSTQIVTSGGGAIEWQRITDVPDLASIFAGEPTFWISPVSQHFYSFDAAEKTWLWRWQWCGFDFGESQLVGNMPRCVYVIPYWSIVIPLTLVSAYLLLGKPHKPETIVNDQAA